MISVTEITRHDTEASKLDLDEQAEAVAVAHGRAEVYGLLAAVFDGDVEPLAAALEDGAFVRLADALDANVETEALDRTDLDRDGLRIGYDNLLAVPGPHYVPPFASAHVDDPSESFESDSPYHEEGAAGEFLGDPAAAAAKAHAATGFELERGDGVPDHLAVSFEFMSALCEREAELLAEDSDGGASEELSAIRASQRDVVDRLDWLESFQEAVAREDTAEGLFAELAAFAHQFVSWDRSETG